MIAVTSEAKPPVAKIIVKLTFSVLVIMTVFFSYGPGLPVTTTAPEDEGYRQQVEKMPDTKPDDQLEREAAEDKPKPLKAQDRGFKEESEEADDYLKKYK